MTLTYGFFDAVASDRVYNALQLSSIFDGIIEDGVFLTIGDKFNVLWNSGMGIYVQSGRAWFNHTWTYNDSNYSLTVSNGHATLPRIDTVVLEINSDSGTRANSFKMVNGTPASSPVPATLTHTASVNQYPLAYISVAANALSISQADITQKVGSSDCPYVTAPLEIVDVDDLFAAWDSAFDTWFNNLVNQLSENQATNLQNQINQHDHSEATTTPVAEINTSIAMVATANLQNDSVDDTKVGNRVPQVYRRQGGDADDWGVGGSSNYTPTMIRMQPGACHISSGGGSNNGSITVTFPVAFAAGSSPLILHCPQGFQSGATPKLVVITDVRARSNTGFTIDWKTIDGSNINTGDIVWLAIGKE